MGVTGTGSREEVGWGRLKADEIGGANGVVREPMGGRGGRRGS